jgi:hypothetical protein
MECHHGRMLVSFMTLPVTAAFVGQHTPASFISKNIAFWVAFCATISERKLQIPKAPTRRPYVIPR